MTGPLLELEGVTKRFGRVVIAEDLSLAVGPGQVVGIVGPNGAGKTSLFGLISGDLSPGAGEIRLAGRAVTKLNAAARCRLGVGRTYQVPRPFGDMTVFENLLVATQQGGGLRGRASYAAAVEALDRTGLSGQANVSAERLGLLQRKRLELARALATQPTLLLLGRSRGRPASRDRPRRQRGGHRGDLDRARGARAHPRGGPADLPGRRQVRRRR
jgi:branched-chain amino acid transport system ATP-binding protein